MSVDFTEEQFGNYGKCLFLDNGTLRLGVTADVGPRIVFLSVNGLENIMFRDDEKRFSEPVGEYGTWYAYGGHRLWCSPEINPETYFPDNDPVNYSFDGNSLTLMPPATPFGKQFSMTVTMSGEGGEVRLTHKIKNISEKESKFAAWSITSLTDGGVCFVPLNTAKTGYLPNRTAVLWDYADIRDPRFELGNDAAFLHQDKNAEKAFKAGFNSEDGFAAYTVNGQTFVKVFEKYKKDVCYPDFGCNVEVYTNNLFLECETLGEMKSFAPGETAEISEKWYVFEGGFDPCGSSSDVKKQILSKISK